GWSPLGCAVSGCAGARPKCLARVPILAASGIWVRSRCMPENSYGKHPSYRAGKVRFHENRPLAGLFYTAAVAAGRAIEWREGGDGRGRYHLRHQELRHDEEGASVAR